METTKCSLTFSLLIFLKLNETLRYIWMETHRLFGMKQTAQHFFWSFKKDLAVIFPLLLLCVKIKTPTNSNLSLFHPDGDMTEADRKQAQAERQRRAALRSSVIQELRQQYSDAPEEIRDRRDFQSERESHEELHRCLLVYCIWAGIHMKADGSVIKWLRMQVLGLVQDIGVIATTWK